MVVAPEQAQQLLTTQAQRITTLEGQLQVLQEALETAQATIQKQQYQLNLYLDRLYGRKSEHFHPDQLRFESLFLQGLGTAPDDPLAAQVAAEAALDAAAAAAPPAAPPTAARPRRHTPHGRLPIPDHLERVVIDVEVPEKDRVCPRTGLPLVCIGYQESEKLEYSPGRLYVNVYRIAKYASPDRSGPGSVAGVITAPMPDHPIPKCKADPGLISYAIVSKFADHLPFYRQDGIFAREGVDIARSTLDGWALTTAEVLWPLGQELKRAVLDGDVLFTDDSVIPLLEPGRGRTRQARLWVYVHGGVGPRLAAYDFTVDRCKGRPLEYLADYQGYVHADAYKGYDELFRRPGIIEVGCWCHARRGFDEALPSRPQEASEMLTHIRALYQVEAQLRGLRPEERHQGRLERVQPLLDTLLTRVEEMRPTALPSEPLRKALEYVHNQEQALRQFLDDGRLEADNNTAENAIRPLSLGRKNWLFAGSERGGQAAALYLGLIQSCKACQVNPWTYLDDILRRILSHPVRQLRELLPDRWRPLPRRGPTPVRRC
jgi:transposase